VVMGLVSNLLLFIKSFKHPIISKCESEERRHQLPGLDAERIGAYL